MKTDKRFLYALGLGGLAVILLLSGASPSLLLLLVCPAMMMFMMHGMNHDHSKHRMDQDKE